MKKERTYIVFTSPKEVMDIVVQALHHLPPLGFRPTLSFERVGQGTFNNKMIGAVANGPSHKITVNIDWYEAADKQDLHYLIWHETRHLYQWSQIVKMHTGQPSLDNLKVVRQWEYELKNYIYNTPATEYAHMKQDMEIDAYSFAVFMLFHYFRKPDGHINIGLPPMTEDEIMDRVNKSLHADCSVFRRVV